ncbi:Threonylcarbamoyladenosine tRNA methylthiotransferase, partial [Perkinsus olseni]
LPGKVIKERSTEVTNLFMSYSLTDKLYDIGELVDVWFDEVDEKRGQTVGHTKRYTKVIVPEVRTDLMGEKMREVEGVGIEPGFGRFLVDSLPSYAVQTALEVHSASAESLWSDAVEEAAVSQSVEEGRDWVAEVEYDSLDNIINTAYVMAREDKDNGKRNFEKRLIPLINEHHSLSAHHALVLLVLMQDVGSANRVTGEKILEAVEN